MNLYFFILLFVLPAQLFAAAADDFTTLSSPFGRSPLFDVIEQMESRSLNPATEMERFCKNQLNSEIQRLLNSEDSNSELLSHYYQMAQMKLTAQVLTNDDQSKLTLEQLIRERMKQINIDTVGQTKLMALYEKYGQKKTIGEAAKLLHKFKNAEYGKKDYILKGTDIAVLSHFIRSYAPDQKCKENPDLDVCLNKADEAALWIAGYMNRSSKDTTDITKDNLEPSDVIAHYTGHAIHEKHRDEQALTASEIKGRIEEYNKLVKAELEKLEQSFLTEFEECQQFYDSSECFYQSALAMIPRNLEILAESVGSLAHKVGNEIEFSQEGEGDSSVPYLPLRNSLRLNVGLDEVFVNKVKEHQKEEAQRIAKSEGILEDLVGHTVAWEEEEVKMCGGQLFKSEMKNVHTGGLDIGGFKGGKNAIGNAGKFGKHGTKAMSAANARGGGNMSGKTGQNWLNFTEKFYIPGPMFRCAPDPVLKPPFMSGKTAEKKVCCNDNPEWRRMVYLFFTGSTGFHCRAFVGVPYIAELGVKVGAGISVSGGGGLDPNKCENEACAQLAVTLDVSAAVYGEVVAGAASAQGTVAWQPYASLRQCGIERWGNSQLPPARFNYKIGIVTGSFTVKVGWVASYHVVKVLYSSNKNQEHDIALF